MVITEPPDTIGRQRKEKFYFHSPVIYYSLLHVYFYKTYVSQEYYQAATARLHLVVKGS